MPACLPACLPARPPACLPACSAVEAISPSCGLPVQAGSEAAAASAAAALDLLGIEDTGTDGKGKSQVSSQLAWQTKTCMCCAAFLDTAPAPLLE